MKNVFPFSPSNYVQKTMMWGRGDNSIPIRIAIKCNSRKLTKNMYTVEIIIYDHDSKTMSIPIAFQGSFDGSFSERTVIA